MVKLTTVAGDIFGKPGRAMLKALVADERDPEVLADLALSQMRKKTVALKEALTGRFDAHHAELARTLLGEVDALNEKIGCLTTRVGSSSPRSPRLRLPLTRRPERSA